MINEVHFSSRYHAERVEGRVDTIVVSIHDRHAKANLRSGFRDVLYLAFDDYDRERDGADALMEPFTAEQAETLKSWIEAYLRASTRFKLLVHCHAGISRSAAVAWWAHKALGIELKTDYPTCYLNRHVLRTLDAKVAPPAKPDEAPEIPKDRSFGPPPLLGSPFARKTLVVFAHGKESGPWGTKIRHLAHVAKQYRAMILSPNYGDLPDIGSRVARLLDLELPPHDDLILVGSSMGAYVSLKAAASLKPRGLFLMAPAIGVPGYEVTPPVPASIRQCIVHGWRDDVVSADDVIHYAASSRATLHLLDADHRLADVIPEVGRHFDEFLARVLAA